MMGRHQLGFSRDSAEGEAIVTWLRSLKGKLPTRYIASPELSPSAVGTPQPDRS